MTLTESPRGSCVCARLIRATLGAAHALTAKPHDGVVNTDSHTATPTAVRWLSAVVVVVCVSKMGSNDFAKRSQIPVWDLTLGWFDE